MCRYALVFTVMLIPVALHAADDLDSLRDRFKQRYARLVELKSSGKIGETYEGYVEAVSGGLGDGAETLLAAENADRRKLYAIIAEREQTTPDRVATRNAARNFEKAEPGEYLKDRDGKWKRKK